ncbi:unnamed protein product, partial [Ectocarpus fasciculatus]
VGRVARRGRGGGRWRRQRSERRQLRWRPCAGCRTVRADVARLGDGLALPRRRTASKPGGRWEQSGAPMVPGVGNRWGTEHRRCSTGRGCGVGGERRQLRRRCLG